MRFATEAETFLAALVMTRWLPELVRRIERGVKALGVTIEKKAMFNDSNGGVCPVLFLRSNRESAAGKPDWRLELRLRNAMDDFLLVDRDEKPARLDPRLLDPRSAERKLREVIEGRLAMVKAFEMSGPGGDVAEHLQKLGGKHGRFKVWRYEDGAGG